MSISFLRPTYVEIYVSLNVSGLFGFTTATQDAIKAALVSYLNSLQIGESVTVSALYAAAMSVSPSLTQPLFSIQSLKVGTSASPSDSSDIAIDFDEVAQSDTSKIVITTV
jgi:uncharacterized phage protein gp47/JayE